MTELAFAGQINRLLIDQAFDGVTLVDHHGVIIEWNRAQERITGMLRSQAIGRFLWDVQHQLTPPEQRTLDALDQMRAFILHLLSTGQPSAATGDQERVIARPDGEQRIVLSRLGLLPVDGGFMLIGTLHDVTEPRRLTEELRRSETWYRVLFEQAGDALFLENERDEILDVNRRACELLGYTRDELLRMKVSDLQAPEARGEVGQIVTGELLRYQGQPFEAVDVRCDGTRLPVEITETRLTSPSGDLVLTTVRDITDRKRAEQALRDSEQQFRLAFDGAAIGKALVSMTGQFRRVNDALCRMLGYSADELLARTFRDLTHPDDLPLSDSAFQRVLNGELDTISFEKRYRRGDGGSVWVIVSSSLIRDAQGRPQYFISEMQDVTERRLAEIALQESEEKYRQLFELESDAIFVIDNETGEIMEANPAASNMYGYSHDELLHMRNTDLSAEPDRTRQAMSQRQSVIPVRWHHDRTGRVFPVEIMASFFTWRGRPAHLAAIRNITDRFNAEQQLRESEQRYRAVVDTSPDAIVLADLEGRLVMANQRAADLAARATPTDLIGLSLFDLLAPEDRARARANMARVMREGTLHGEEYLGIRPDGTLVPIEVSASVVNSADQRPMGMAAVVRDIAARKEAEALLAQRHRDLAQLNAELQVRNEELDAFAHTVAHDLKNPLHLVIGFAETLRDVYASLSDEERIEAVRPIVRSARKMNNIIDELLLLAEVRKSQVSLIPIDLERIVADAQQRLADMIADAKASITLPASWPSVLGHAPWVEEVLVNYLSNAIKYGGRPPVITLGTDELDGNRVRFWVCDNGDGISPDVQSQLFKPFSRLVQAQTKGHGLGLSIVQRIVERMGGQVGVESSGQPGQGSLFFFTLPMAN
jgi:PAS domain S-box-containing protein